MTTKETHKMLILKHMKTYGSIDQWAAYDFGCTKLATRISEMIRAGVKIRKTPREGINRFGKQTRWMEYSLMEDAA